MEILTIEFVIAFWIASNFLEAYLHFRQLRALRSSKNAPLAIQDQVPHHVFVFFNQIMTDKRINEIIHVLVSFTLNGILLVNKFGPWWWKESAMFLGYVGLDPSNEIYHSLLFLGVFLLCTQAIDLLFSAFALILIDADIDSSPTTVRSFLAEFAKRRFLEWIFNALNITAIIHLKRAATPYSVLCLWPLFFVAAIVFLGFKHLFPRTVFHTVSRLQDGALRKKIASLVSSNKFPINNILVGFGKRYNNESQTLVSICGISNKFILIDESLINGSIGSRRHRKQSNTAFKPITANESASMVAHEMGHWKFNYPMYEFAITVVRPLINLAIFEFVAHSTTLYLSFGFDEKSVAVTCFIFQFVIMPVDCLIRFAEHAITRSAVFKADAFTRQQGYGAALRTCLQKFLVDDIPLKDVATDPWFSAHHLSHPSFIERLATSDDLD